MFITVCMRACVRVCVCACVRVCVCACVHACVCACISVSLLIRHPARAFYRCPRQPCCDGGAGRNRQVPSTQGAALPTRPVRRGLSGSSGGLLCLLG